LKQLGLSLPLLALKMKDDAMSPEIQGPLEARKKSNKTFPASDTKEPDSADTFILPL
jgi:hypothetical protein